MIINAIKTVEDYLSRDSAGLAQSKLECPLCGRAHAVPFGLMQAGSGILSRIPQVAAELLGRKPRKAAVVYDQEIEALIQEQIIAPIEAAGLSLNPVPLGQPGEHLESEVYLANQAADSLSSDTDLLVAAGSGVICDSVKWIATRLDKPFILCGSAPSMNGYTSITATMTEDSIKTSRLLRPADAVMLDVDVLKAAPMEMIRAGMGDLAARAICNADWKLGQVLKGAYFCPLPYQMTERHEKLYLGAASGIGRREATAHHQLAEAIMMSGLSMTILGGETSPSSGAEHVLSHFWDLLVHLRGLPKNLHGAQVGVGTIMMLALYDHIRHLDPGKIDLQQLVRQRPACEQIEAENLAGYGEAGLAFNEVVRKKYLPDQAYVEHIRSILSGWEALWAAVDPYIPPLESIRQPLMLAGVPLTLDSIQRTPQQGIEALLHGSRYRLRYTILDLAWELGVFPTAAEEILAEAGVI
jgi:glycerol-1-phosphate dehydrogenase [NAD(P)+]